MGVHLASVQTCSNLVTPPRIERREGGRHLLGVRKQTCEL